MFKNKGSYIEKMKKNRLTIFISEEGIKALKIMAIEHGLTMSNYVEQFVVEEYQEWQALKKNKEVVLSQ